MMDRINQVMRARLGNENGTGSETSEEGFTLVELLIVVVVLGILAAVTVFGLSGTTSQSHAAACNADVRSVEVAVEAYHAANTGPTNNGSWPANIAALTTPDKNNGNIVYLRTKPVDTHYVITIDATNGHVLVALPGGAGADYDAALNQTPSVNLCSAVT